MGDREKYFDQHGRKHDSMLDAQWADEEIDNAKKSSGSGDDTGKMIVFISIVYIGMSFVVSLKFFRIFDPEFSNTTFGGIITLGFCLMLVIIYFWRMTKFKSGLSAAMYSCAATAAIIGISWLLPALP